MQNNFFIVALAFNFCYIISKKAVIVKVNYTFKCNTFVGLQYIYDTVERKETEGKREENKG